MEIKATQKQEKPKYPVIIKTAAAVAATAATLAASSCQQQQQGGVAPYEIQVLGGIK